MRCWVQHIPGYAQTLVQAIPWRGLLTLRLWYSTLHFIAVTSADISSKSEKRPHTASFTSTVANDESMWGSEHLILPSTTPTWILFFQFSIQILRNKKRKSLLLQNLRRIKGELSNFPLIPFLFADGSYVIYLRSSVSTSSTSTQGTVPSCKIFFIAAASSETTWSSTCILM